MKPLNLNHFWKRSLSMASTTKKPKSKRVWPIRYVLPNLSTFNTLDLQKLIKNEIQPKLTHRLPKLWVPKSKSIIKTLFKSPLKRRISYLIKIYGTKNHSNPKSTLQKWNLAQSPGFSLTLSLPLYYIYKEYEQAYAQIIHSLYLAIIECANKPPYTKIKFKLHDRKIELQKNQQQAIYLKTPSTHAVWNISPWWAIQLALLLANLYPLTFPPQPFPYKLSWTPFLYPRRKWITITPITYQITPEKYLIFCNENQLSPLHGFLHYLIKKFLEDDNNNHQYYNQLQLIILYHSFPKSKFSKYKFPKPSKTEDQSLAYLIPIKRK